MAELDPGRWSAADDDLVRGALTTLRRDVEALELADVRFVKARGAARHRRTVLTATAAAAAAVLAVGYVGFSGLGGHPSSLRPAVSSTHSTSSTTTSATTPADAGVPLPVAGDLPVSAEWQRALGISETVVIADFTESEGGAVMDCANVGQPGTQAHAQSVNAESSGLQGDQRVYGNPSTAAADGEADTLVSQLLTCAGPMKVSVVADSAWPKVFSGIGPASTEWFVVTHAGSRVGIVTIVEPGEGGKHRWTVSQVQDIGAVAQRRLGGDVGPQPGRSTTTPPSPTRARTEQMPIAGTRPLLPSSLFVAASQWSSPALSQGHATHAVTTDWEGSAQVHECDVDTAMDMTSSAGRFGIVTVADQVDGTILGRQRVRLTASAAAARAEADRIIHGIATCGSRVPHVTVTQDPAHPGLFKVVGAEPGAPAAAGWLAVSVQDGTPAAVTTLYLRSQPAQGFAELDRLLSLARQK
ncbi:hypothetical protein [Oryzihumus sp.]|uniref:hypothetical protein n=1 Tax=Oryzihumus sp. TaxID=1968903 RepID=UPI002EDA74C2